MRTFALIHSQSHPEIDYDAFCECSEESRGNYYDFIPRGSGRLVVSVGDLPTTGISSITVPCMQALVRGLTAGSPDDLGDVARELNGTLYLMGPRYICAPWFCGLIDPVRHELRYVNGGHQPPFLIRQRGNAVQRLDCTGAALGLSGREVHRQETIGIESGDLLAIFSEGLAEVLSDAQVLDALLENQYDNAAGLTRRIFEAAGGHVLGADRTFAAVRIIGAGQRPVNEDHAAAGDLVCAA